MHSTSYRPICEKWFFEEASARSNLQPSISQLAACLPPTLWQNTKGRLLSRNLPISNSTFALCGLQHPLRRQDLPGQPFLRHRRLIQRLGQCLEDGFHDVMRVTAVEQIHVQIEPAMGHERLKEILEEP